MKKGYEYEIISKNPTVYFLSPEGNILKVKIIGCDFNKYVDMIDDKGNEISYKWGYVYNTYDDAVVNRDFDFEAWCNDEVDYDTPSCVDVHKLLLSKKNYSLWKKTKRKEYTSATEWYVAEGTQSLYDAKKFKRFVDALNYLKRQDENKNWYLGEQSTRLHDIITIEDGVCYYDDTQDRVVKSRHIGKSFGYKSLVKGNK